MNIMQTDVRHLPLDSTRVPIPASSLVCYVLIATCSPLPGKAPRPTFLCWLFYHLLSQPCTNPCPNRCNGKLIIRHRTVSALLRWQAKPRAKHRSGLRHM